MAELRPFRGLRYNTAAVDPALAIAPPYDVIAPEQQAALYARSPYNVVRVEYGEERGADDKYHNRYTRAARTLAGWRDERILVRDDAPALYPSALEFEWEGRRYRRQALLGLVRLEPWERGIIKPHERTFSKPKEDRLKLLRETRTQISPVYCIFRPRDGRSGECDTAHGALAEFVADGQRHALAAVRSETSIERLANIVAASDVYVADGHHRYETALAYRDEARARAARWTGDEPENFVLMALTNYRDPGLLVLPTHRIVSTQAPASDVIAAISRQFDVEDVTAGGFDRLMHRIETVAPDSVSVGAVLGGQLYLLVLRDRAAVERLMPPGEAGAWKHLDVNVLHYGILAPAVGIDDRALAAGAVTYAQDAREACGAARADSSRATFLLRATPIEQMLAVADAGARMPPKSTYFYPKLPTGLVMYSLEA